MQSCSAYIFEAYINEGLLSGILGFFKKLFKSQSKLGKTGKTYKVDINNIKRSKKPIDFENLETEQYKKLISDKKTGFPILNEFVKNPKKFIGDNTESIKTYMYFSKVDNNILQAGIVMLNEKSDLRKGEGIELVCVDTSLLVENQKDVQKRMIDVWIDEIKKDSENKNIKYIFCKPSHPKISGILSSNGFVKDNANKEIYVKLIK